MRRQLPPPDVWGSTNANVSREELPQYNQRSGIGPHRLQEELEGEDQKSRVCNESSPSISQNDKV